MKEEIIKKFNLLPHPEGGYFAEIYRSEEVIKKEDLPERYNSSRNFGTSIYFMIDGKNVSNFHRLKSDEFWYFHSGSAIEIHIIYENGSYKIENLGNSISENETPSVLLPKGCWFGAKLKNQESYGFVSCAVFPGFDFSDFELAERKNLLEKFPQHKDIILELTKD